MVHTIHRYSKPVANAHEVPQTVRLGLSVLDLFVDADVLSDFCYIYRKSSVLVSMIAIERLLRGHGILYRVFELSLERFAWWAQDDLGDSAVTASTKFWHWFVTSWYESMTMSIEYGYGKWPSISIWSSIFRGYLGVLAHTSSDWLFKINCII